MLAFNDINPGSNTRALVPKRHISTLNDLTPGDDPRRRAQQTRRGHRRNGGSVLEGIERCSTRTGTPGRPCSTSTCTCSVDDRCSGPLGDTFDLVIFIWLSGYLVINCWIVEFNQ